MTTITTTDELREQMGNVADRLNIFLAVSTAAFDDDGEEHLFLSHATSFQIEGYVLRPRKLHSIPVEIVTHDPEEARYILGLVRDSQVALAERQAEAVLFASQAILNFSGIKSREAETIPDHEKYQNLGGAIKDKELV